MIAFGSSFPELVFGHIDHLPGPGEEIFTDEFAISCGGAVSIASAARRAGVAAGVATVLGTDLGSRVVWEHCRHQGINLSPSVRVAGPSAGVSVVLNFDGDRAFVSHLPRPLAGQANEIDRWQSVLERERPAWAYLHAGRNVAPLLRRARELGTSVALDVSFGAIDRSPADIIECVRLADVFVPNAPELRRLTGLATLEEALEAASEWGTAVIAKRGAGGAVVLDAGEATEVTEGLRDVEVRDRTGAGDAFAGAMIASLFHGATLIEAAGAGNAAGSSAVARLGAVGEVDIGSLGVAADALGSMAWAQVVSTAVDKAKEAGG
jgi:sugar/nucleoside kinase (ribokinase family)